MTTLTPIGAYTLEVHCPHCDGPLHERTAADPRPSDRLSSVVTCVECADDFRIHVSIVRAERRAS